MEIEEVYNYVNTYYNDKYANLYGHITQEACKLYYQKYGNDFIDWLKDINDNSAHEIILFAMTNYHDNYDKLVKEMEEKGVFNNIDEKETTTTT